MDIEDQILNGIKLITNTRNQRLKIQSRGQTLKNTILKIENKINHKNICDIYIYMTFALKNRVFYCKVAVGYRSEN